MFRLNISGYPGTIEREREAFVIWLVWKTGTPWFQTERTKTSEDFKEFAPSANVTSEEKSILFIEEEKIALFQYSGIYSKFSE